MGALAVQFSRQTSFSIPAIVSAVGTVDPVMCRIPQMLTAARMIYTKDNPGTSAAANRKRPTDTTGEVAATTRARAQAAGRVLLVDDDADFLQLLRIALKQKPYDFVTAISAIDALEILRKEVVDVVVADENMPGMSGTDLLGIVAREFPACGRIIMTGHATVDIAVRAVNQAGIASFYLKSCDPAVLGEAINKTMGAVAPGVDPATGLHTRRALEQRFGMQVRAVDGLCSVVYMDIDRLHIINQVHGFGGGDEVIRQVADLLVQSRLPSGALRARISGDQFVLVLPGFAVDAARALSRRLQAEAARIAVGSPPRTADVSISVGIAMIRHGPDMLAHALTEAEVACRGAKDRGRNRVEQFDTNDTSLMQRRGDVIAAGLLREALKADDFLLHAQPIVSLLDTTVTCGYELLLRMRGKDGNTVSAAEIISAAHRYQLMPAIDHWVVQHAMRKLGPHRTVLRQRGMCMSINISGQSIGDPEFLSFLAQQLTMSGLAPSSVMIEITEQTAISTRGDAADRLRKLCGEGWGLALDDFGTGTNSFANLKELPVARIKIDGRFVLDLLTSRRSAATIQAIAQLAKTESIDTVAEFVETPAIAQKLRELGIDYGQGYAFGKPQQLDSVLAQEFQHGAIG
jgi:diguanylate cyclase (GGDEF)-like protein